MRAVWIGAGGLALAVGVYALSRATDGFVAAALLLLALTILPVSLGIAIATATRRGRRPHRYWHPEPQRPSGRWGRRRAERNQTRCGGCGRRRQLVNNAWLCPHCDAAELPKL